jgi:hypothetical protein
MYCYWLWKKIFVQRQLLFNFFLRAMWLFVHLLSSADCSYGYDPWWLSGLWRYTLEDRSLATLEHKLTWEHAGSPKSQCAFRGSAFWEWRSHASYWDGPPTPSERGCLEKAMLFWSWNIKWSDYVVSWLSFIVRYICNYIFHIFGLRW